MPACVHISAGALLRGRTVCARLLLVAAVLFTVIGALNAFVDYVPQVRFDAGLLTIKYGLISTVAALISRRLEKGRLSLAVFLGLLALNLLIVLMGFGYAHG